MNLTGQYATDFQAILSKAVQTAEVPLTLLQTQDTHVLASKAALGSLQSTIASLTASLTALGHVGVTGALSATSSDPSAVTVVDSGATAPASYTINSVTSMAATASETSTTSYVDPSATPITTGVTTPGEMQLVVGARTINFALTSNNLTGLVNQINGMGAGVTAQILTTSSGGYLSLTATSTGATTLQLNDTSSAVSRNIITANNQGTNAVFQLNGIPISQASNTINNVIPGLTFNITGKSASPTTLTLASDSTQLGNDLQSFVSNYNALVTAVAGQVGTSGGALVGNSVISQVQQAMRQLTSHISNSTGSIHGLADVGVTFNGLDGSATFDSTVLGGMSSSQMTNALSFIGSATTGLGAFSQTFNQFSDPISGLIHTAISGATTSDVNLQKQIATTTANINSMQRTLAKQIEASDALESQYESQQRELTASLQGLNLVLFGKAAGSA